MERKYLNSDMRQTDAPRTPAASDTSPVMSERTAPPQNRRSTIHDNDSENVLVEAVTYRVGGAERVVLSSYRSAQDVDPEERFVLSLEEAAELYNDLGKFLTRRGILTTAKAGERAA